MAQPGRQLAQVNPVRQIVTTRMPTLINSLPGGSKVARKQFQQAAISLSNNPDIMQCTPESVLSAIYACARLALIPDPVLHLAAVVPFYNGRKGYKEATLIIEYRGLMELAKRACPNLRISAGTVYENDIYIKEEGTSPKLIITKRWWEAGKDDPGSPLFFYCVWQDGQGPTEFLVVSAAEARKIGGGSKAGAKPGTPWHDHFERMGEKTAIRRSSRFWRLDPEKEETRQFREALEYDERTEEIVDAEAATDSSNLFGDPDEAPQLEAQPHVPDDIPDGNHGRKPRAKPTPAAPVEESKSARQEMMDFFGGTADAPATKEDIEKVKAVANQRLAESNFAQSGPLRNRIVVLACQGAPIKDLNNPTRAETEIMQDCLKVLDAKTIKDHMMGT